MKTAIDKVKEPKLTLKQRKWLAEYFKTGNATKAALVAYDTSDPEVASVIASQNLTKLREPVKSYMEFNGLSLGTLVESVKEGLAANKVLSAVVIQRKDSSTSQAEGELPIANSRSTDFIEVPDHIARHKYVETAAKWLGMEKKEPTTLIQQNFNAHVQKELDEFEK